RLDPRAASHVLPRRHPAPVHGPDARGAAGHPAPFTGEGGGGPRTELAALARVSVLPRGDGRSLADIGELPLLRVRLAGLLLHRPVTRLVPSYPHAAAGRLPAGPGPGRPVGCDDAPDRVVLGDQSPAEILGRGRPAGRAGGSALP